MGNSGHCCDPKISTLINASFSTFGSIPEVVDIQNVGLRQNTNKGPRINAVAINNCEQTTLP